MIYYIGILFIIVQDTSFYTIDFRMTSQELKDIGEAANTEMRLNFGMTPVELAASRKRVCRAVLQVYQGQSCLPIDSY